MCLTTYSLETISNPPPQKPFEHAHVLALKSWPYLLEKLVRAVGRLCFSRDPNLIACVLQNQASPSI